MSTRRQVPRTDQCCRLALRASLLRPATPPIPAALVADGRPVLHFALLRRLFKLDLAPAHVRCLFRLHPNVISLALAAIIYMVEAVYRRQHGVCAARVPSLAWLRRGAAHEQPWGARQRLAGWRRAWQTYSSMWLICLDGGSLRAHVRSLCQLVIALDRIRSAGWSWSANLGTVGSPVIFRF